MILHPPRLEGCVLAVVGENDQPLLRRNSVDHILGQNMNVSHRDSTERPNGFDNSLSDRIPSLPAAWAGPQISGIIKINRPNRNKGSRSLALGMLAIAVDLMQCPAVPAEEHLFALPVKSLRRSAGLIIYLGKKTVRENHSRAFRFVGRLPIHICPFGVSSGQLAIHNREIAVITLCVVLPTILAYEYGQKCRSLCCVFLLGISQRETQVGPKARLVLVLYKIDDGALKPLYEVMDFGPQERAVTLFPAAPRTR